MIYLAFSYCPASSGPFYLSTVEPLGYQLNAPAAAAVNSSQWQRKALWKCNVIEPVRGADNVALQGH